MACHHSPSDIGRCVDCHCVIYEDDSPRCTCDRPSGKLINKN